MGQTSHRRKTPPAPTGDAFGDLVRLARQLQGPQGCAWDRAQTLESLLPYLVEETWELFDSIKRRDQALLTEELGDTLYTVLCLALIAERDGLLRLNRLLAATRRKMIRRHEHVFGTRTAATPASALGSWQSAKRKERKAPSASKRLRPVILAMWERLRRDPAAAEGLAHWLKRGTIRGAGPRQPSGKRARRRGRSSRRAPGR